MWSVRWENILPVEPNVHETTGCIMIVGVHIHSDVSCCCSCCRWGALWLLTSSHPHAGAPLLLPTTISNLLISVCRVLARRAAVSRRDRTRADRSSRRGMPPETGAYIWWVRLNPSKQHQVGTSTRPRQRPLQTEINNETVLRCYSPVMWWKKLYTVVSKRPFDH